MNGAKIRAIRARLDMSQSEFAELLGVPKRTLQEWEQDRAGPRAAAIRLLELADSGKLKKPKR